MDVISRPKNLPPFLRALDASITDTAADFGGDGASCRLNLAGFTGTWLLDVAGDDFIVTRPDGQTATAGTIQAAVAAAKAL